MDDFLQKWENLHSQTMEYLSSNTQSWKVKIVLIGPCSSESRRSIELIQINEPSSYKGEGENYIKFINSVFKTSVPSWIQLYYIPALDADSRMNYQKFGKLLGNLKDKDFDIIYIHSSISIPVAGFRIVKNLNELTYTSVVVTGAMDSNLLPLDFPSESVISVSCVTSSVPNIFTQEGSTEQVHLGGSLLDFVVYIGNLTKSQVGNNNEAALYTLLVITAILRRAQELFTGKTRTISL